MYNQEKGIVGSGDSDQLGCSVVPQTKVGPVDAGVKVG